MERGPGKSLGKKRAPVKVNPDPSPRDEGGDDGGDWFASADRLH